MPFTNKKLIPLAALIVLIAIIVFVPRLASSASPENPLPTQVAPEPDPFSDRYPAVVSLASADDLQTLYRLQIDIDDLQAADGTFPATGEPFEPLVATVYVNPDEAATLAGLGLEVIPIENESLRSGGPDAWPTYDQFVTRMQDLASAYPQIVKLVSIGKSVQNRDLWCMEVSDNVSIEENEPEFRYVSTMHGDETTGVEMTMRLAELLANNYGTDPDLTALVDGIETWLCPIYNPDGYVNISRYNAHGADLNRDYPDRFTDPIDDPSGREPETQAFMYFGYAHRFVMGANYHGGSLVLNYPWDAVTPLGNLSLSVYAPDDQLFHDFGVGYTSRNPMIWNGGFPEGVTRGWEWYQIWGGMQDWAYFWHGEHHVTIEVSSNKRPSYDQMDTYWNNNREAMLWWMERSLTGIHGLVLDAYTLAPLDAKVTVMEMEEPNFVLTDPDVGDYHRVIGPGEYTLQASAEGYESQEFTVTVISGTATVHDFYLNPPSAFSSSSKEASVENSQPGAEVGYQLVLQNSGPEAAAAVTDTLPVSVTWTGELSATQGVPTFADGQITWQGTVNAGQAVTITYAVTVGQCLPGGTQLVNLAEVDDQTDTTVTFSATVTVDNLAPSAPELLSPANDATDQPLDTVLDWNASADLNCDALTYNIRFGTANPPPLVASGLSETGYDPGPLQGNTTYYWSVTASDGFSQAASPTWHFTTLNRPPDAAQPVAPVDGAQDVPTNQTLEWKGSDPDGDTLTYDLAFGDVNPPPVIANGLTGTTYDPGLLQPYTTYYWAVTTSDSLTQTASATWQFTTSNHAPDLPFNPSPADEATGVPTDTLLTWEGSDPDGDILTYTIAFGTIPTPTVVATGLITPSFDPGSLEPGITYYWFITASDGITETIGEVWSFTTKPLSYTYYLPLLMRNLLPPP
jgi:hypothetical protein